MNLQALYHQPKSNYAYAYSETELHIRLRTAKNDCSKVMLVISLKHIWSDKKKYEMNKVASDRYFDYYQYDYVTDDPRLGYYFELSDGEKTLIYSESGISKTFDDEYAYFHYFQFPFINPIDLHRVPEWVHEAVFYQIFVERFCNGDTRNDPQPLTLWKELPKPKSFYGGDLQGIINKLDYLQDLGINVLYLTPIFQSPSNHKYDTTDYRKIDEAFGDKETLCQLVSQAHQKGIRVILDGVFNHSGYLFAPFQDVLKNGENSEYKDWFHIRSFPVSCNPLSYRTFGTTPEMPKLNTSNSELKKYLLDTVAFWTKETGIDGWRLDVSDEIDHNFWRAFRKAVKGINSDAVIIGENWHNAYPWLMGDQFDSVMNYPVTKACVQFFAMQKDNAQDFADNLSGFLMWNSEQVNFAMLNLLDSHDTMRFLTWCGGNVERFKLAVLFLFSYIGIPCTYYGSEIETQGNGDPDCRRTFDWNETHWNQELYKFYKHIILIRKEQKALQYGSITLYAKDDVFFLKRTYEKQVIVTVINNTALPKTISLNCQKAEDILTQTEYEGSLNNLFLTMSPYSGSMYLLKTETPTNLNR